LGSLFPLKKTGLAFEGTEITEIGLNAGFEGSFEFLYVSAFAAGSEIVHDPSDQLIIVICKFVLFAPNVI
jgi:hypothetical protein